MDNIVNFHLIRPYFLLLLIPLFFWRFIRVAISNNNNIWRKAIDFNLLSHLFSDGGVKQSKLNHRLVALIWLLLTISLCGPAWKEVPKAMYKNLAPTVILLDSSVSMNEQDISPTRLFRSVLKIYDILELKRGSLFSLIAYSNEPYVIVPLSDDPEVIKTYLPLMSSSIMPAGGSRLDRAIELAQFELEKSGLKAAHIVILTDSASHYENYNNVIKASDDAADNGYIVSVFGVGKLKNEQNSKINYKTSLNEKSLIDVIEAGKGRYHRITNDDTDIEYIFLNIEDRLRDMNPLIKTNLDSIMWQDEGILFLIPVLFLFPLLFRKGAIAVIVVGVIAFNFISFPAYADDIRKIFLSPEQYGKLLLNEGKYNQAEVYLGSNTQLLSIALIKTGRAKELVKILSANNDFETLYNVGTILAKNQEYFLAKAAFEKALKIEPDSYEANFNLAVVKKIIEKISTEDGGGGSGQDGDNEDEDNSEENKKNDNNQQDQSSSQQQQNSSGGIQEDAEDVAALLRQKLYNIFLIRRYGATGEEIEW